MVIEGPNPRADTLPYRGRKRKRKGREEEGRERERRGERESSSSLPMQLLRKGHVQT